MDWKWTDHIEMQLLERKISKESVETAINNPDQVIDGKRKRKIYQKLVGDKLLRVIAEDDNLITAYLIDKIKKYMGGV
jgi:transcriptional regulator NrdR family protein